MGSNEGTRSDPPRATGLRERLADVTAGASTAPLIVLFGLNFVDELDQILFSIATPEIRDDLDLGDGGIIAIAALVSVFVLFAVLPLTYVADRFNRARLVFFAAIGWMSMSVLTGLAGWAGLLVVLVIARMGSGLGRTINDPVHASLLTDYYRPEALPRVFQVHRAANPLSRVTAVVIGAGAGLFGWQAMFLVIAAPTVVLIGAAARLPNPRRGSSSAPDPVEEAGDGSDPPADEAAEPTPVSFREARRTLFSIPSMRRLYLGAFLLGSGFLTVGTISALFFEDIYGFSPLMRGVQAFLAGAGTLAGLTYGQRLASRAIATGDLPRLATITGLAFTAGAVGLVLMAAMPFAAGSLLFSILAATGFSAFQPAYYPLVSMVTPPHIRTQAYGWSLILVGCGGVIGSLVVGGLAESSYRTATVGLATMVGLAGVCGSTAARFVARDVAAAQAALAPGRQGAGADPVLAANGLEAVRSDVRVLRGVDVVVRPGECVALLGTDGGAPALLDVVTGHLASAGGTLTLAGVDVTGLGAAGRAGAGVVRAVGTPLAATRTVAEHLRAAAPDDPDRSGEVLRALPGLQARADDPVDALTPAVQRLLALGVACVAAPTVLVVDDLSSGLAPGEVDQVVGALRRVTAAGTAVLLTDPSTEVALTAADRAYFLEDGEVRFEGPTADLRRRDDIARTVRLEHAGAPARFRRRRPPLRAAR